MAQHDYSIANQSGSAFRADLNNALSAIVTNNSGASAPSTTFAFQWWADETTGQLKLRNAANSDWIVIQELDGTMLMENGTAAAPGLAFASDLNTGFYRIGADQLGIATNGTAAVAVDASQRVGIGTTTPSNNLHVKGSGDAIIKVDSSAAAYTTRLSLSSASGTAVIENTAAEPLGFQINSSEKMRIDSSGRLLVGTSSTSTNATMILQGYAADANDGGILRLATGKSTPASGDVLGYLNFTDSTHTAGAQVRAERDGGTWSGSSKPGRLVFSTTPDSGSSPVERLRIDNVGTTKITGVANDVYVTQIYSNGTSGQQYGLYIKTANDQNDATRNFLECIGGATTRLTIRSNGGIANYSANNVNLSDRNVKKDIAPAAGTWDCLKEWEIVNFRYKDQPDDADLNMGVIAQQVAESCPEVIQIFQEAKEATETEPAKEERLGVKDQQMMWMAIKALQEAQLRIETLEAEVAALKGA